jgi:hypothetical protein
MMRDWLRWALLTLCLAVSLSAVAEDDEEDFDVQEEGVPFDHTRTGLHFKRILYDDNMVPITNTPYFPTKHADTSQFRAWKIFVAGWEQDPPNSLILYLRNDTTQPDYKLDVDLEVTIGHASRQGHFVQSAFREVKEIPVDPGLNRIPLYIQNFKGDLVKVDLVGVYRRIGIKDVQVVAP